MSERKTFAQVVAGDAISALKDGADKATQEKVVKVQKEKTHIKLLLGNKAAFVVDRASATALTEFYDNRSATLYSVVQTAPTKS